LAIAVIHATRTHSLDLNVYMPACQPSLNAATEQPQVHQNHTSLLILCCWCCWLSSWWWKLIVNCKQRAFHDYYCHCYYY